MTSAADLKAALHRRYAGGDGRGEQYVCIEEARSGAGHDGNNGACDFLAVNTFKGRGMELIGHEVKVSAGDWRAELKAPEKAERFACYCRRWYVVMPSALAKTAKHEVPPAWGLLSLSDNGRWTEVVKAPRRPDVLEVPAWWWVGWLAQFDRQAKRSVGRMVEDAMRPEREAHQKKVDAIVERQVARRLANHEVLVANAEALREATGIDLVRTWKGDVDRLGRLWSIARSGVNLEGLAGHLRNSAAMVEALVEATTEVPTKPH